MSPSRPATAIRLVQTTGPRTAAARPSAAPRDRHSAIADDEAGWVADIRAGDAAAFKGMFRAYYEPLHVFALGYVQDSAIGDELVQDVLCWVWEHRATWVVDTSLKTYLFGAVRNRVLNYLRRQRITQRWVQESAADALASPESLRGEPADARVTEDEFARALHRELERLPARCREAYVLRWRHDLSYREIADQMGTSVKTVEVQIAKALKMLRQGLAGFF